MSGIKTINKEFFLNKINPFIGVYDCFSAKISSKYFNNIFLSGYGYSASHLGMPDQGYITWEGMSEYVLRVRNIAPNSLILVDMDEGYGDPKIAGHAAKSIMQSGANGVVLEDQRRPKKCGHIPGKEVLTIDEYLPRLESVLNSAPDLFVVARTDVENLEIGIKRIKTFIDNGASFVMIEGIQKLNDLKSIREEIPNDIVLSVNLINGGQTKSVSLTELKKLGVNIAIYSTPCLFSAQYAIEKSLEELSSKDGMLSAISNSVSLLSSRELLESI
tara:strand:- start:1857 stop:2678 length:822 start_codon:yes stop_codon:yes gene_type:complete